MKTFLPLLACLGWAAASLAAPDFAEPETTPAPATPPPTLLFRTDWAPMPRTNAVKVVETEIRSQRAYFDLNKGRQQAVYLGNVRVRDPRMDLNCEKLIVKLSTAGKFENVIAETNVSVDFVDQKGQRLHGTGGRAVYTYNVAGGVTNDVIELFEDPMLETVQGTWKGDVITLDRVNNTIKATNSRMVIRPQTGTTNVPNLIPNLPQP
jgi:lipopolysaccharide transport protein LptA